MRTFFHDSLILAQEAAAEGDPHALSRLLMLVMGFGLLMYFFLFRPQKRREEGFRRMVSELKENDHVVTAGGIHGVVTNVQREAERITIRVDEATGTKLRVSMSSISRVVNADGEDAKTGDGKSK